MRVARHRLYHPGYTCRQHRHHGIDCQTFLDMLTRAAGACEVCRTPWNMTARGLKPCIDHDHASPIWAVRGLVCARCNAAIAQVETGAQEPDTATTRFLANAWYRNEGLPVYLDRARRWLQPIQRAEREAEHRELFGGRTPPARYQRIQAEREAWCLAFVADQQALL